MALLSGSFELPQIASLEIGATRPCHFNKTPLGREGPPVFQPKDPPENTPLNGIDPPRRARQAVWAYRTLANLFIY